MRSRRLIEPVASLEEYHAQRLGVRAQRDIVQEIEENARRRSVVPFRFAHASPPFYRANVGGSGDATYNMRLGAPSSDSAWAMVDLALPMPMAGCLVGGYVWSSEARTAGTARLEAQIVDAAGTRNVVIPGCVLNATNTQAASQFLPESTIRFSMGAQVKPRITTAGSFAPSTADMGAVLLFMFDQYKRD